MGKLKIGVSKVEMNFTQEMFDEANSQVQVQYGVERPKMKGPVGVYFPLFVRALAVSDGSEPVVFVSLETSSSCRLREKFRNEMQELTGVNADRFIVFSVHNHGGPSVKLGTPVAYETAKEAILQALNNMQDAYMGFAEGKSYINVSRDEQLPDGEWCHGEDFGGFSDKTAAILRFDNEKGEPLAMLVNFGCHATLSMNAVNEDGEKMICADFPGYTSDYLERLYPGSVVLWSSGCAADQSPIGMYRNWVHYKGAVPEGDVPPGWAYHYTQYMGERHALDLNKTIKDMVCKDADASVRFAWTDAMYDRQNRIRPEYPDIVPAFAAQNNVSGVAQFAPELVKDGEIINRKEFLEEPHLTGEKVRVKMELVTIGDVAIVGSGSELYSQIGVKCKEMSPFKNTFVITHVEGHDVVAKGMDRGGYIQSNASAHARTYQHFSDVHPGNCDEITVDGMLRMFLELQDKEVYG